jgi:hypothetical protein
LGIPDKLVSMRIARAKIMLREAINTESSGVPNGQPTSH